MKSIMQEHEELLQKVVLKVIMDILNKMIGLFMLM